MSLRPKIQTTFLCLVLCLYACKKPDKKLVGTWSRGSIESINVIGNDEADLEKKSVSKTDHQFELEFDGNSFVSFISLEQVGVVQGPFNIEYFGKIKKAKAAFQASSCKEAYEIPNYVWESDNPDGYMVLDGAFIYSYILDNSELTLYSYKRQANYGPGWDLCGEIIADQYTLSKREYQKE